MKSLVHTVSLIGHLLGLVLGLGGAALTDFIFVLCVRAQRVGRTLLLIMKWSASLVLVGYGLLVISGIGLLASGSHVSSKFYAKMFVVLVVGINGTLAHSVIFPKLAHKIKYHSNEISIAFLHQLSVVAAISGVSWMAALILGAWKTKAQVTVLWALIYLIAVLIAVVMSLLLTPNVLKVEDPDFQDVFPVLAANRQRATLSYPQKRQQLEAPQE